MRYFLWLMPEPTAALHINGIIHRLATIYEQIPHMAHITLGSWSNRPSLSPFDSGGHQAARLMLGKPQIGSPPWKTIFLPVEPHPILKAYQGLGPKRSGEPHLSLFYGEHSTGRCLDILRTLRLKPKTLLFSQLALIQGSNDIGSWTEIARWPLKETED